MIKKVVVFIFCCFIKLSALVSQSNVSIDTILLLKASSNIPIMTSMENMILSIGITNSYNISFNHTVSIRPLTVNDKTKDTIYYFNAILCRKKGISYYENNGRVRLSYIDLKKNKDVFISTDKIILSRNLMLEELMKIYNYTFEDIAGPQARIMAPYPMRKCHCFYQINFSTGEQEPANIELYFDCKKRLRFISITACDF
jgi:hypothetical protein